jgi:hypothetical protein
MSDAIHIDLTRALATIGKPLGISVDATVAASADGYRIRARLPVIVSSTTINESDLSDSKDPSDMLIKAVKDLQRSVFETAWQHIERHDQSGEAESLRRITKTALEMAMHYMPPDDEKRRDCELMLKYVTRERK